MLLEMIPENIYYIILALVLITISVKRNKLLFNLKEIQFDVLTDITGLASMITCFLRKNKNKLHKYPERKGEIALITGGGRGIGKHIVVGLLKSGMHVIMGVRDPNNCEELTTELNKETLPGTLELLNLDISSMKSVRKFAEEVDKKHPKIHLLVHNAGIVFAEYKITEDGFESQLATNYLGHFLLTYLLMKNLAEAGKDGRFSRIISVSSCTHLASGIFFDDINFEKAYHVRGAYSQSKLAQIMMTSLLNREMESRDIPIRLNSVNPGVAKTSMIDKYKENIFTYWITEWLAKTSMDSATSVLIGCLSEDLEGKGGLYLSNGELGYSSRFSQNELYQNKLFQKTCDMLKIKQFWE